MGSTYDLEKAPEGSAPHAIMHAINRPVSYKNIPDPNVAADVAKRDREFYFAAIQQYGSIENFRQTTSLGVRVMRSQLHTHNTRLYVKKILQAHKRAELDIHTLLILGSSLRRIEIYDSGTIRRMDATDTFEATLDHYLGLFQRRIRQHVSNAQETIPGMTEKMARQAVYADIVTLAVSTTNAVAAYDLQGDIVQYTSRPGDTGLISYN